MHRKGRHKGDGLVEIGDGDTVYGLGYDRVSREEQALGLSLDAQRADRLRYMQARGWVPYRDYEDVMSGRRDNRPDYQALLAEARRLRDDGKRVAIVVADLDRLGRKLGEQIRVRDEMRGLDVAVHFVRQGGALDDLTADMLGAVAANESRRLSERVKNVRRYVRTGGWHTPGRPAWGYLWRDATDDERRQGAPRRVYDIDPKRAPLAREALEAVAAGTLRPYGVIVWMGGLTDEQRGGRAFDFRAARRLLSAAVYVARYEQPTDVPVLERPRCNWPALISDETYAAIQARLEARSRVPGRDSVTYLLTGFLRCARCGSKMAGWMQTRYGRRYRRYRCYGAQGNARAAVRGCSAVADATQLDAAVLKEAQDLLAGADDRRVREALERAWARLSAGEQEDTSGRQRIARGLRAQIVQARARIDRAVTLYLDNKLDEADYRAARERETATTEACERELTALGEATDRRRPTLPPLDQVLRKLGGWSAVLQGEGVPEQREVLAELIERVVPVRISRGKYTVEIAWTPLGDALSAMPEQVA